MFFFTEHNDNTHAKVVGHVKVFEVFFLCSKAPTI